MRRIAGLAFTLLLLIGAAGIFTPFPRVHAATPTLSIDGSNGAGCPNTTTFCSTTLTTQSGNDVIIAFATESLDKQTYCNFTVTDTSGLSWTARSANIVNLDGRWQMQEFWARSASALSSDTVTDSIIGCGPNYNNIMVFGISGANYINPFDPNTALPGSAVGFGGDTAVNISTNSPNDVIFAAVVHGNISAFPTAEQGFMIITPPGTNAVEFEIASSTLTNSTVSFSDTASGEWVSVADAVQASAAPGFSINATPFSQTLRPGSNVNFTIMVQGTNGFNSSVSLNAVVSPLVRMGPSVSLPSIVGPYSTSLMIVSASRSTTAATYTITVTATSGSIIHSITVTVVVARTKK